MQREWHTHSIESQMVIDVTSIACAVALHLSIEHVA